MSYVLANARAPKSLLPLVNIWSACWEPILVAHRTIGERDGRMWIYWHWWWCLVWPINARLIGRLLSPLLQASHSYTTRLFVYIMLTFSFFHFLIHVLIIYCYSIILFEFSVNWYAFTDFLINHFICILLFACYCANGKLERID